MSDSINEWEWPMAGIESLQDNDVVYGRGGLANNNRGNCRFRLLMEKYKPKYAKCHRHEKTALAEEIAQQWRDQSPPGRFLKQDEETGLWYDVGPTAARLKVSQTIREGPLNPDGPTMKKLKKLSMASSTSTPSKKESKPKKSVPPPPPTPKDELCVTPPQSRPEKDFEVELSPTSVMDRTFYDIDSVEEANQKSVRKDSKVLDFFKGVGTLPGLNFPRRQKSKRSTSEHSSSASDDYQPPTKRQAYNNGSKNPFASYFHNLVGDKMPHGGPKTFTLVQDNAVSVPEPSVAPPNKTEVVYKTEESAPAKAARGPTFCTNNCAPKESSVFSSMKLAPSIHRNQDSIHYMEDEFSRIPKEIFKQEFLEQIENTWSNMDDDLGLDFDNDPIFTEYEENLKKKSKDHTMADSPSIRATPTRTKSSSGDSVMDNLSTLLRDRCDTGTSYSSGVSALKEFEKAYPDAKPHHLSLPKQVAVPSQYCVPQPEPDPSEDDEFMYLAGLDDAGEDELGDNDLDGWSRHSRMSVLSMESAGAFMKRAV